MAFSASTISFCAAAYQKVDSFACGWQDDNPHNCYAFELGVAEPDEQLRRRKEQMMASRGLGTLHLLRAGLLSSQVNEC